MDRDVHDVWVPWNLACTRNLVLYMLQPSKMTDQKKVFNAIVSALPVLENHRKEFNDRSCPTEFMQFYARLTTVFTFVDEIPMSWKSYLPIEDEDAPELESLPEGFSVPSAKPDTVPSVNSNWQTEPLWSMANSSPIEQDIAKIDQEEEEDEEDQGSDGADSPAQSERGTKAVKRKVPGDEDYVAPKRAVRSKVRRNTRKAAGKPASIKKEEDGEKRVSKRARTEQPDANPGVTETAPNSIALRSSTRSPKKNPTSSSSRRNQEEDVEEEETQITGESLDYAELGKQTASAVKTAVEEGRWAELEQINLRIPDKSELFVSVVKRRKGRAYHFVSGLRTKSISRHRNSDKPWNRKFDRLDLIPIEDLKDLNFETGIIPKRGCTSCGVQHITCIPTALGASCQACIKNDVRFCDHTQTMSELLTLHAEIEAATAETTETTNLWLLEAKESLRRLQKASEAHYDAVEDFAARFGSLQRHALRVVKSTGPDNFLAAFKPSAKSESAIDILNGLIMKFNDLTTEDKADLDKGNLLRFEPPKFQQGILDLLTMKADAAQVVNAKAKGKNKQATR